MKKVAILQSNYIPWKGYFDLIGLVDEFIFYDEMQYTTRDWRNRNKIVTPNGLKWLSIPVLSKGHQLTGLRIMDALISDHSWSEKHWNTIHQFYKNAPFFEEYKNVIKDAYISLEKETYLVNVNYAFIKLINSILGINTKISFSQDYGLIEGKTERLVDLVLKAGGTEYISGPSAKDYINQDLFKEAGIKLSWMDYSGYKEYKQMYGGFNHYVSILDLIFNCGDKSPYYLKSYPRTLR